MAEVDCRLLAGISVPASPLVERAIEYARQKCEPYLFNHVVRSWLFAARLGQLQCIGHDAEVVAVGTLLHDITLNENFSGPRRFEVEGADLARSFARECGFDERRDSTDLGQCRPQFDPLDRPLQRGGGVALHRRHRS